MKNTSYKFGKYSCNAYMKPAGQGWEVGFKFGPTTVFVGNFIHQKEATKWWGSMNKEMKSFTTRFGIGATGSVTWYTKSMSHHLYKTYYTFLDREFTKYHRTFDKACKQDAKTYNLHKSKWKQGERFTFRKAA